MTPEEMLEAGTNLGFAIATIKAFTEKPGVSKKQIDECLQRLNDTLEMWAGFVEKNYETKK